LRRKKSKREYGRYVAACLACLAVGCGGEEEPKPRAEPQPEPAATETAPADIKDTTRKPEVPEPSGKPPRKLKVEDIVKGTGAGAKSGDSLSVQYVGVSFSTGEQFDASWDSGQPFDFQLGAQMVIPGWDRGLVGIRPGGRRQLTIPPRLAYGAQGSPPAIGPNETLVFVIDRVR
jgi:peptidylprolyl isomerase